MFFKITNYAVFSLILIATVLTWLVLPLTPVSSSDVSGSVLISLLNAQRSKQGLVTLKVNAQLQKAAQKKGEDMLAKKYWAHFGPNGESPWNFILKAGYDYEYAGENLAKGFNSSEAVETAWMNSPTHRENLLNPYYDEVGIAVLYGEVVKGEGPVILVVQMFGSRFAGRKVPATVASSGSTGSVAVVEPKVSITSPKEGSVLTGGNVEVSGTADGVKSTARVQIGSGDIAEIGIQDRRFHYKTPNIFDAQPLVITVSAVTPQGEARSSSVTVFNNPNDFIQSYYRTKLAARPGNGSTILLTAPAYPNVLGVTLQSCQADYSLKLQDGEFQLPVAADQYEQLKTCPSVLQVKVPPSSELPVAVSELPVVTNPASAVAGIATQQNWAQRLANTPINWFAVVGLILTLIGILVGAQVYISVRRNHFHLHHHYFALVGLFVVSTLVKLFFGNGTIV